MEKKQAMEEPLKERRFSDAEEWGDTVFADGGVTQRAAAGSRSSEAEGDLFVSEVQGRGSGILWPSQGAVAGAEQKSFKFFEIAGIVSKKGGAAHTINFCRNCYNARRLKHGEEEAIGVQWRAMIEQKSSRGKLWAALGVDQFLRGMRERLAITKKRGPDRSWQMQRM